MHRYYWPEVGRYIQPDPVGLSGYYTMGENSITQYNIYTYALNDPINKTDATGLWTNPTWRTPGRKRGCDCCGCGHFGAGRRREGYYGYHLGVDILAETCCPRTETTGGGSRTGSVVASIKILDGDSPKMGSKPVKAVISGELRRGSEGVEIHGTVDGKKFIVKELHISPIYETGKMVSETNYIGDIISAGKCETKTGKTCDIPLHVHLEVWERKSGLQYLYDPTNIVENKPPSLAGW